MNPSNNLTQPQYPLVYPSAPANSYAYPAPSGMAPGVVPYPYQPAYVMNQSTASTTTTTTGTTGGQTGTTAQIVASAPPGGPAVSNDVKNEALQNKVSQLQDELDKLKNQQTTPSTVTQSAGMPVSSI